MTAPIMASTVSAITESFITELSMISSSPSARPTVARNVLRTRWARMRVRSPSKLGVTVEDKLGHPAVEDRVPETPGGRWNRRGRRSGG